MAKHEKIFIEKPEEIDFEKIEKFIMDLKSKISEIEDHKIKEEMKKIVPTYNLYKE